MAHINRYPVESGAMKSLGYDAEKQTLAVEFNNGGVFNYTGVTQDDYFSFINAESRGKHFQSNIRGKFTSAKSDAPPFAACRNCGHQGMAGSTCEDCGTAEYGAL